MNTPRKLPVEAEIYNLVTDAHGTPDGGYQDHALGDAIGKLLGLARKFEAERALRHWHNSGASFARAVERKGH
jgi:hypothetical protein